MNKAEYIEFHKNTLQKMIEITKRKNADYTGGSDDPFNNFRHIGELVNVPRVVEIGFLTRMSDKLARVGSFVANGTLKVTDESVGDTLMDLANYSILMLGFLTEQRHIQDGPQPYKESYNGKEQDKASTGRDRPGIAGNY